MPISTRRFKQLPPKENAPQPRGSEAYEASLPFGEQGRYFQGQPSQPRSTVKGKARHEEDLLRVNHSAPSGIQN
jgi:hypothetical protein